MVKDVNGSAQLDCRARSSCDDKQSMSASDLKYTSLHVRMRRWNTWQLKETVDRRAMKERYRKYTA